MPGNLEVRNLGDELIRRLKRRAALHGRSIEAEHHEILRQASSAEIEPAFEELAGWRFATADERLLRKVRSMKSPLSVTIGKPPSGD